MKVEIHTLFQYLLDTTAEQPEAIVGLSLARSPSLGDFLADLDPALTLLEDAHIIRNIPEPAKAKGGRPARLFGVNPALWGQK